MISKTFLKTILSIISVLSFSSCGEKDASAESKELLNGINKATAMFDSRTDMLNARSLIINSVNRGLSEKDSLVLVESIDKVGTYQCVSYTSHNKMITFYNARKGQDTSGFPTGEYIQSQGEVTPYEALSFIDTFQAGSFEQYYNQRNEDKSGEVAKWWVVSFVTKDEDDQYQVKCYLSK